MGFPSGHSGFCPRMLAPPANTFPRNALFPFQQASIRVFGVAPGKYEQFCSGVPPSGQTPYAPHIRDRIRPGDVVHPRWVAWICLRRPSHDHQVFRFLHGDKGDVVHDNIVHCRIFGCAARRPSHLVLSAATSFSALGIAESFSHDVMNRVGIARRRLDFIHGVRDLQHLVHLADPNITMVTSVTAHSGQVTWPVILFRLLRGVNTMAGPT